ncbi:hypothetical protein V8Z74_14810 [Comamonas sp. w2-DMI]|uniref:hypothetical protein n=1 Tax=Comamonas sp. w2-DMI TaxID=3126391 RepID=UPI0032E3A10E
MASYEIEVADEALRQTSLRETTAILDRAAILDLQQQGLYAELRAIPSCSVPHWKRPHPAYFE